MNTDKDVKKAIKESYMDIQPPAALKTRLMKRLESEQTGNSRTLKKLVLSRITGIAAAGVLVITLVGVSPVVNATITSSISSIISMLGDIGQIHSKQYSQDHQVTVEDHGVSMTIREVLYDGTRLTIGYETDLQQAGDADTDPSVQLRINGIPLKFSQMGIKAGKSKPGEKVRGLVTVYLETHLPEQFQLELLVNRIGNTSGSWEFNLPVSQSPALAKTFTPNITEKFEDMAITVKRINFTSGATELEYEIYQPNGYKDMEFDLFDNYGNNLKKMSYKINDENQKMVHMKALYAPVDQLPTSITIEPKFDAKDGQKLGTIQISLVK